MAALLCWATPAGLLSDPTAVLATLRSSDPVSAVTTVIALLAWLTLLRLVLGAVLLALASAPGPAAAACLRLGRLVTPALLRGAVEALLGVSVLTATAVGGPALANAAHPPRAPATLRAARSAAAPWRAAWQQKPVRPPVVAPPPEPAAPSLDRPAVGGSPPLAVSSLDRPARSAAGRNVDAASRRGPAHDAGNDASVVVQPGDTLWDIAARHLRGRPSTADIAAAWPRWYAVNRDVVGPDPDLLHPGQRLIVPSASSPKDTP